MYSTRSVFVVLLILAIPEQALASNLFSERGKKSKQETLLPWTGELHYQVGGQLLFCCDSVQWSRRIGPSYFRFVFKSALHKYWSWFEPLN